MMKWKKLRPPKPTNPLARKDCPLAIKFCVITAIKVDRYQGRQGGFMFILLARALKPQIISVF